MSSDPLSLFSSCLASTLFLFTHPWSSISFSSVCRTLQRGYSIRVGGVGGGIVQCVVECSNFDPDSIPIASRPIRWLRHTYSSHVVRFASPGIKTYTTAHKNLRTRPNTQTTAFADKPGNLDSRAQVFSWRLLLFARGLRHTALRTKWTLRVICTIEVTKYTHLLYFCMQFLLHSFSPDFMFTAKLKVIQAYYYCLSHIYQQDLHITQ